MLPGVLHPGALQRVQALLGGSPPAALEVVVLQKGFLCPAGTSSAVSLWKMIYFFLPPCRGKNQESAKVVWI